VVPVLGIAQIISWGSLYYPIACSAAIRRDLGIGDIACSEASPWDCSFGISRAGAGGWSTCAGDDSRWRAAPRSARWLSPCWRSRRAPPR
jgi:hypothetical protein